MFDNYLERWNLVSDGDVIVTNNSRLLPVSRSGEPAMLKIAVDPEEKAGASLMVWWDGDGAARVLAQEGDALLLERSNDNGKLMKMARTGQDDEASRIVCAAATRLHSSRDKALPVLVPLTQWFHPLEAAAAQRGGLLTEAAAVARELLGEPREIVALHGDIHHQNILDFGERGWLAIDPKGLLGERGYDFANTLDNPDAETAYKPGRLARQASVIAEAAGLDRKRLLKWVIAYGGLSQSFYLKDDIDVKLDLTLVELAMDELTK